MTNDENICHKGRKGTHGLMLWKSTKRKQRKWMYRLVAVLLIFISVVEAVVQPDAFLLNSNKVYADTLGLGNTSGVEANIPAEESINTASGSAIDLTGDSNEASVLGSATGTAISTNDSKTAGKAEDSKAPSAPVNVTATAVATATGSAITLAWEASDDDTGVMGYRIYRNDEEIGMSVETNYMDTTVVPGESYIYTVMAFDAAGNLSEASDKVTITIDDTEAPSAPMNVKTIKVTDTEVTISWDASSDNMGVVGYKIYRDGEEIGTTIENSYTDILLSEGKKYSYTVKAFDKFNNLSEASVEVFVKTKDTQAPSTPTNLTVTAVSDTEATLTWEKSTDNIGVVGYDIYGNDELVASTDKNTYTVTGLEIGNKYTYTVKARDEDNSSEAATVTFLQKKPLTLTANVSGSAISADWTEATDADGYEISFNGKVVQTGKDNSYTNAEVLPNTWYECKVRSIHGKDKSAWSASVKILTAPGKVTNLKATPTNNTTIELTWESVAGASSYEVEANGTVIATVSTNYYTHSSTSSKNNTYRVRAVNGKLKGPWSDVAVNASRTYISAGTISKDTVWDGGTYIIQGNIKVAQGVTLQIEPGTTILCTSGYNGFIEVCGKLLAKGTAEKSIVFTSEKDPEYGGSGKSTSDLCSKHRRIRRKLFENKIWRV